MFLNLCAPALATCIMYAADDATNIAAPDPLAALASTEFHFNIAAAPLALNLLQDTAPSTQAALRATDPPRPFGLADTAYWTANVAAGTDLDDSNLARLGGGMSYFMADDISIDFELNFIYFSESSDNVFGVNANLLFRWHFFMSDNRSWSVYAEGGAGLLGTSDDIPASGTSFNFTPQIGAGVSFDVDWLKAGENARLFIGARWHHVSNARLYENNPGEDYGVIYAMMAWPF